MKNRTQAMMNEFIEKKNYEEYLNLCIDKRIQCLLLAQKMFPAYYNNETLEEAWESYTSKTKETNPSNKVDAWEQYNSKAEEAKAEKNVEKEISILEDAIESLVDTPWTYDRLAMLYMKEKKYKEAFNVCELWFNSDYWKIPNMAKGSLKILKRFDKLKTKI